MYSASMDSKAIYQSDDDYTQQKSGLSRLKQNPLLAFGN